MRQAPRGLAGTTRAGWRGDMAWRPRRRPSRPAWRALSRRSRKPPRRRLEEPPMQEERAQRGRQHNRIVSAAGELPKFPAGERVRVMTREPIGHYRVPAYVRGKSGVVEAVVEPSAVDNEEEGYGRNAG